MPLGKPKPPSLLNLCLGVLGKHLEDVIQDLEDIVPNFPDNIKKTMAAIARRRKLLNDNVLVALADSTWDILDLSGSVVTDVGLSKIAEECKFLRAVDISRCSEVTIYGVSELLQKCRSLEVLRCGGCPWSDKIARRCLGLLRPNLNVLEKESWEDLDTEEISHSAPSLRWLLWPKIDDDSLESLSTECPRIIVNPKPSPFGHKGTKIPKESLPGIALDASFVEDIDPKTWSVIGFNVRTTPASDSNTNELSMAEKFRLAFVERDMKFAPKRAKNVRQHERRAKRDWVMTDTTAKAAFLAAKASKSLNI